MIYIDLDVDPYNKAVMDAEKCLKKLIASVKEGGLTYKDLDDIFGCCRIEDILNHYGLFEIMEKMEAYEEEQKIKVGDIVICPDTNITGVVIETTNTLVSVLSKEEDSIIGKLWVVHTLARSTVTKTDKSFPELAAIIDCL